MMMICMQWDFSYSLDSINLKIYKMCGLAFCDNRVTVRTVISFLVYYFCKIRTFKGIFVFVCNEITATVLTQST